MPGRKGHGSMCTTTRIPELGRKPPPQGANLPAASRKPQSGERMKPTASAVGKGEPQTKAPAGRKKHSRNQEQPVPVVAGVDLGGTAINYTLVTPQGNFLIEG